MQKKLLVSASLVVVFALIVFLNDVLKDPLTVQVGDATSTDMPLSSQETGSLQGLSEAGQGRKAIQPGFVDQGRSWVPGSESRFFNSDFVSTEKGLPRQSLDMLRMAQTRQMLAAYTRSLQVRATQAGIPPHQAARLSAEVASVALSAQVAGVAPAQTLATTRLFGEKALSSSLREQKKLSFISTARTGSVGGAAGQVGVPPAVVRMTQVSRQQHTQQAIQRMMYSQK